MKNKLLTLAVLISQAPVAFAASSGAAFLKIDSDARAVSMGSAYTALASGVSAMSYNISGISFAGRPEVGFSHTSWLMDSNHDFVGVALPLKGGNSPAGGNRWVAGLGLTRLSNSSTEVRNADRSVGGSFSAYDQSVSVGLARALGRTRLGMGIKYLESSIAGEKAATVAVDMGFSRSLNTRLPLSLGLSVQNLGRGMRYISQRDPLPLSLSAGLSSAIIPGLNLAVDVRRLVYDKQTSVSLGTEYAVFSGLSLRSGYLTRAAATEVKGGGISAGVGLNIMNASLDYSVTPYGELGNTQKITLKKSF
ncbi:MAG TPA: hypothetical protein DCZ93_09950 [Elusimicrobia bacterium]|nr:hypothetical protein [Elusimicrobiota bacterium]